MIPRLLFAAFLALIAGCASLPPECKTEYAHTISRCPSPLSRPPATPVECKKAGGVPAYQNGQYRGCMSRDELRDLMRGLARPFP